MALAETIQLEMRPEAERIAYVQGYMAALEMVLQWHEESNIFQRIKLQANAISVLLPKKP